MNALYGIDNEATRDVVTRTLARLPADVQQYVESWCLFVVVYPRSNSRMLALHCLDSVPSYLIILDHEAMQGPHAPDIVGHEVAHAWLDHTSESGDEHEEREREADDQAAAWGFGRKMERATP